MARSLAVYIVLIGLVALVVVVVVVLVIVVYRNNNTVCITPAKAPSAGAHPEFRGI